MKRFIFSALFVVLSLPCVKSQNMSELFVKMPDDIIVQLEQAWRKDLVDLYRSGKTATLENTMQGKSTLLKLENDYLLVQTTERSTVEMKLLPLVNNTYVVCVVTTVAAPIEDSTVKFYTVNWEPLKADDLFSPVSGKWFFKEDVNKLSSEFADSISSLDMDLIKYHLSADNTNLVAEYMTPKYLNEENQEKVLKCLKNTVKTYEWKLGRFE